VGDDRDCAASDRGRHRGRDRGSQLVNLVALASALSAAIANVTAGAGSRRVHPSIILLISSPVSVVCILVPILFVGGEPTANSIGWGLLAGVSMGLGLSLAFVALGKGPIGAVTAAISATTTMVLTLAGLLFGEVLTPVRVIALFLCLAAIGFVTYTPGQSLRGHLGGPAIGVLVGALFAGFGLAVSRVDESEGLWPVLPARIVVVLIAVAIAAIVRVRRPAAIVGVPIVASTIVLAVVAGIFDIAANATFLIALRITDFTTVALNTSISPVFAAIISAIFLGERMRRLQIVGLVLAVAGSILIALS
jgi:drug/metabolite transporter (DMT)-like permease